VAQWDVKAGLRVRRAVLELADQHRKLSPADFQKAYVEAVLTTQNDFGYPGFAPVASDDTANADRNLRQYISQNPAG
jgi:hypothetical protein